MPARKKKGQNRKAAPAKQRRATTTRRKSRKSTGGGRSNPLTELRRQAQSVIKRLQRVGWRRINAIEKQIDALNHQRQALVNELGAVVRGVGGIAGTRTVGTRRAEGRTRRARATRARADWDKVYAKLPRGTFKASDVRKLVPGVAPGTLSQRLTAWVKARKLRRTGSRRGTRYTRT